jgi:hypothetical protein
VDVDVELEVDCIVGLVFGEANKVEGPVVCCGVANVELDVPVLDEANVERFELLTGPPSAEVSLKP